MHRVILITSLLVTSAISQSTEPNDTATPATNVSSTASVTPTDTKFNISTLIPHIYTFGPDLNADTDNNSTSSDNCIHVCLNAMNVVIFGVVISLVLCICAVICQQQPREIFYLVDRVPEANSAVRPTSIGIDSKVRVSKSPAIKEPVTVGEPLISPKHSRTAAVPPAASAPDSFDGTNKKSTQTENLPQSNVNQANSQLYCAQESIEDYPSPIISLLDDSQHQRTPFARPSTPIGAPAPPKIPIIISESGRVSEPSTPLMPV